MPKKSKTTKPKIRKSTRSRGHEAPILPPTTTPGGPDDMGGDEDLEYCERSKG